MQCLLSSLFNGACLEGDFEGSTAEQVVAFYPKQTTLFKSIAEDMKRARVLPDLADRIDAMDKEIEEI